MQAEGGKVEFDLADLLRGIDAKLESVSNKLDSKADRVAADAIDRRLTLIEAADKVRSDVRQEQYDRLAQMERRLVALEHANTERVTARDTFQKQSESKWKWATILVSIVFIVAGVLSSVLPAVLR